ncbi:MAG: hypothetical protein ACXVD2_09095, partial [Actinomycetota bacterium]
VAKSVEAYLAACPKDQRAALEKLRATIKSAIPEPVEAIAYGMPVVKERLKENAARKAGKSTKT